MKVKSLSLAICSILFMPIAHAAPLSFQEAWDLLQQQNNSLAAQRANVERYAHLKDATQNLNLPSVSVGANFTRLDQDVTLSGKQIVDSAGGIDPNLIANLSPSLLPLVTHLGAAKSTILNAIFSLPRSVRFGQFLLADELLLRKMPPQVKKMKRKVSSRWKYKRDMKI